VRRFFERLNRWGWNLYEAAIIVIGATVAVFLSIYFSEQVNQQEHVLLFLGVLLLYVLFDLLRVPYRGQVISLGFPIVLFALLGGQENGPLIVAEVVVLGSLCSDSLYRLFIRRNLLARFDRVLFYTAHHTLAALAAIAAFGLVRRQPDTAQLPAQGVFDLLVDPNYLLAIVAYLAAYSLVSSILIMPHDGAIRNLRLPEDEERLPRVHPIGSVVLMAPVPIALSVFVFTLTGTSRLILSLVFPALFLAFLVIVRSYANIEREAISSRSREEVRRRLLGLTRFDDELLTSISMLVNQLLRKPGPCWIAIYSIPLDSSILWLRGERNSDGQIQVYRPSLAIRTGADSQPGVVSDTPGDLDEVRWPQQVEIGRGPLGEAVRNRSAQSGLISQAVYQEAQLDPPLPLGMAYLYVPLQHPTGVAGLLALVRPRRHFTKPDLDRLMPLADVLAQSLVNIQKVEKQIEELCGQVEGFVADPTAVRRALEQLVARRVTRMNDILAMIPERAFQKRFSETLDVFAEGRARDRVSTLDDEDLAAIYNEVWGRDVGGMPILDASILNELQTIASSLSVAFSAPYQLFEQDRSEKYIPLYRACQTALKVEAIPDIIDQQNEVQGALGRLENLKGDIPLQVTSALSRLGVAIADLEQSEQAERAELRRERLKDALAELDAVEQMAKGLEGPVRLIFVNWVARWERVISATLSAAEAGEAELDLALRSNQALPLERVNVVLQVRNVGHGVATRITAELLPQTGYSVVGEPKFLLGALQTDKAKEAEFIIAPQDTNRLRLVFQVSYWDSQAARPKTLHFADQLILGRELPPYRPVDSPYVAGLPLPMGSPLFFGRDDVFEFIRQNVTLGGRREPQVLVLVGERRVGKTSIAKQLPSRLRDEGYIHVYFDAQSAVDPGQFLLTLATCIVEGLQDAGIAMDKPAPQEFQGGPGYAFEYRFLPQLWEHLGNRRLLIAIDEYETLQWRVESKKEDPDIFEYLRSLIQHSQRMAFIFFGSRQMQDLTSDYWHVLFNITKYQSIGLLSPAEARRLIEEPVHEEIVYDELAIEEILRGTGRHPYFLQMVCDKLVESCNEDQVSYMTVQRVRKALREVVETGRSHLEWLWNSTSAEERVVLAGLAECLRQGELGTAETIVQRVHQIGQELQLGVAHQALGRLAGRQILNRPLEEANFYEFTAGLYYTWIRLAHPLAQQVTGITL
jgi:GTPase SAR1 family protein